MPGKLIRYVGIVTLLWMFVLIYMGYNLFSLVEESKKSSYELDRINIEVDKLRRENDKLQLESLEKSKAVVRNHAERTNRDTDKEDNDRQNNNKKLENAYKIIRELEEKLDKLQSESNTPSSSEPSKNYELLQRRVANQIKEMWFYLSAQLTKLNKVMPSTSKDELSIVLENFGELQRITEHDFEELIDMDGGKKIRDDNAKRVSDIVAKRLYNLQNPSNCDDARKLVCNLNKGCGYGCQMHHVLYCFIVSYATKRTMILNSDGWRYSSRGWKGYFLPVSDTCTSASGGHTQEWGRGHEQQKIIHLPIVDSMNPRPKTMPLSVPRDLYDEIVKFHGHPFVWWIGQFSKYLFRYQPGIKNEIEEKKKLLGFQRPIVGIQVRRTDKINLEAAFHKIEEYMYWVDLYYKKLALTESFDKKRVYIASDDATVLPEAKKKYRDYEFLSDNDVSKAASLKSRYTDKSLHGVISDIEILSDTDFLVCTFSSQVCRLAYEIMNGKKRDASQYFRSLDDIYYFGGQQEHRMKAIWPHKAKNKDEIDLEVGDEVGIAGNHWDGYAKGLHHTNRRTGLFPAFKVTDLHDVVDFPNYNDD